MVFERDLEEGESREVKVMTLKEIARGTVNGTEEEMSALTLTNFSYEVRQNDVLLPAPLPSEQLNLSFSPSAPPAELAAKVAGHFSGINYIATHETVVIDKGHLDGVIPGHVFQLYRDGADVVGRKGDYEYQKLGSQKKFTLHQIPVGEIAIIRPYEHFSIGVITKSSEPIAPGTLALPPKTND
ncbi:hypothetical protein JCM19237_6858 [Photobacterium aphoticum]|uniref:Uncharacterized protein n=1 Tax=Photobacterium aphoticum TaxID=754436 RepID=A0A090QYW5_9GAMM|nr:hypothetical protein JCM19237_6858 [Photobacterium aphoticum]